MKLIQLKNQNSNSNTAFIAAYIARAHTSIYNDLNLIKEAKERVDQLEQQAAIQKEYRNLAYKGTWKLKKRAKLPFNAKVLLGKLVLKTKRDKNGLIIKRKARQVAKGFRQKQGTNFDQTYARVCKTTTWKLAIAITAYFRLKIKQVDVIRAFLNSNIDIEIYMEVPLDQEVNGSTLKNAAKWMCLLLKVIYRLKQAP